MALLETDLLLPKQEVKAMCCARSLVSNSKRFNEYPLLNEKRSCMTPDMRGVETAFLISIECNFHLSNTRMPNRKAWRKAWST